MRYRLMLLVLIAAAPVADAEPLGVYADALANGFTDQSWAAAGDYDLSNTTPVHAGSDSIRFTPDGWGGLQFVANASEFDFIDYQSLSFWVHGGDGAGAGGQTIWVIITDNYDAVSATIDVASLVPGGAIQPGAWQLATLDFDAEALTTGTFNGINIMDGTGGVQHELFVDDIVFDERTSAPPGGGSVAVTVDTASDVHAFSPYIFGVAFGDAARNAEVGYTVRRWGGNSVTRYNWQADVHNTASDYYYENIPGASDRTEIPPIGNDADAFVGESLDAGIQPLMTIPTIGWTPRYDSPLAHPYFAGFSVARYGAQQSVDPYDTDAGNGYHTDGSPITGNDPHDTSSEVDAAFQQGWVQHFQSTFGNAAAGGVRLYSLDNEVMLWNSTHRDVHPGPTTYDETWANAASYGGMIKQQDPSAAVTGPVTWGYCDLFGSAADDCLDGPDRQAHGGVPFVAWYIGQVCANPLAGGVHVVDYVDLHYYPQGQNVALSDDDSPATAARRLRSLRELYDPNWVSESWIADLGDTNANHYDKPDLIPRVRAWIDQYCPGMKLAITEYNWGNDGTTSGAVAQAELFGIFAREGVDMATRWVAPDANTRVERAYTLLRNYDGAGSKVEGSSVAATSANVDQLGAYGFTGAGRTMVLLTNKDTVTHDAALTFAQAEAGSWRLYGFDGGTAVHQIATGSIAGTSLTLSALPAMSASLLVIEAGDGIFADGFD
ncbi:MAG TPA: glycoside hydrolase family 44 protein [Rhodanobacteraceae bacterium]|nr:glycoside hydrolase family 44 protein [Rhodanobacteraceae bacterium]